MAKIPTEKLFPYIDGLHVLPWLTDGAVDFLDSHIFFIKSALRKNPTVFEFGAGNSTLYFLSRGCSVTSVEHDPDWSKKIEDVARLFGYQERLVMKHVPRPYHLEFNSSKCFDLVLVDGRDRVLCLEQIIQQIALIPRDRRPVLILDNTERIFGKYRQYRQYLKMLRGYKLIHFEMPFVFGGAVTQSETVDGLNLPAGLAANGLAANVHRDRSGNATKGRSITTIVLPQFRGDFTTQGIPL